MKRDKATAMSVVCGIANQAKIKDKEVDASSEADQAAWAIAKVASVMQAVLEKQVENLMEIFTKTFEAMNKNTPSPNPNIGGNKACSQRTTCKNCGLKHHNPDSCWELKTNKDKCTSNWKPMAEHKPESIS